MDLPQRLRSLIQKNGHTAASFADEIDVQRSSVSHVLSGRNNPSLEFIQKVLYKFPVTDIHWLITGEKGPALHATEEKPQKGPDPVVTPDPASGKKVVKVVLLYADQTFDEFRPGSS